MTTDTPSIIEPQALMTEVQQACGVEEPGVFCEAIWQQTGNAVLARIAGQIIPGLLKILVIVALAWLANRLIRRLLRRLITNVNERGLSRLGALRRRAPLQDTGPIDLSRARMRTETVAGVMRSIASVMIWTIAAVMILGTFNINLGPLIAGAGIIGLAIGFGAQNLVKDFLSGIFMLLEDQYGIGDIVDVGEASGKIEAISLRTTRLRDVEGTVWYVPNGEIRRVGNKSQQWARSLIDVGVAYDTDLDMATRVIKEVIDGLWQDADWSEQILEEPEVWGVENFGPDEILLRLVLKVKPARQFAVNRELRARLKAAFDREGIEIPFPQRTVWLREEHPRNTVAARNTPETKEK